MDEYNVLDASNGDADMYINSDYRIKICELSEVFGDNSIENHIKTLNDWY